MKPNRQSLETLLRRAGIELESRQLDQLWAYHTLLRAANARLNLSRLHNFETIVVKHYVDSLIVLKFVDLPSPLVDMGSGPGLPGVPLAIARPDVRFILAEPRGARAEFLREVCQALPLQNAQVHQGKVGPEFRQPVGGVIARAVAPIDELLQRAAYCVGPGGRVLLMKGPDCDAEMEAVRPDQRQQFRLVGDEAYTLPGTTHARRLIVYERVGRTIDESQATMTGTGRLIQSASNATFQELRDLLSGRGIRKQGRALLAGNKVVGEVVERFPQSIQAWITNESGPPPTHSFDWIRLADALFEQLDVSGTHAPLLAVEVPEMTRFDPSAEWPSGCTLFVPFQDPENVGAVIRSAAAFGVARVVLLREAAHPFHPKAARAAGPALFQTPFERGPSITELTGSTVPVFGLSAQGVPLGDTVWPACFGLVAGVEGPGLPASFDRSHGIRIPIAPGVESLNAATAVAVALYEWRRSLGRVSPTA